MGDHGVDVFGHNGLAFRNERVEIAIGALRDAERDMNVYPEPFFVVKIDLHLFRCLSYLAIIRRRV